MVPEQPSPDVSLAITDIGSAPEGHSVVPAGMLQLSHPWEGGAGGLRPPPRTSSSMLLPIKCSALPGNQPPVSKIWPL